MSRLVRSIVWGYAKKKIPKAPEPIRDTVSDVGETVEHVQLWHRVFHPDKIRERALSNASDIDRLQRGVRIARRINQIRKDRKG